MCGIAGILSLDPPEPALLRRMTDAIEHRGPDDEGVWVDRESGIGLGHRRLSIVDLSPSGHQPMLSPDGRLVLNYNGEIYNHRALRAEIEAAAPRPKAAGVGIPTRKSCSQRSAAWGLEAALSKAVGMFALALVGRVEQDADPRPRPVRREAALLRLGGEELPVRLGAEGASASSRLRQSGQPPGPRPFRVPRLRSRAILDLRAHLQAAAGLHPHRYPRGVRGSARSSRRRRARTARGFGSAATGPIATSSGAGSPIRSPTNGKRWSSSNRRSWPRSRTSQSRTCPSALSCRAASTARRSWRSTSVIRTSRSGPSRSASRRPATTRPITPGRSRRISGRSTTNIG